MSPSAKPVIRYSGKPGVVLDYNGKLKAELGRVHNHPRLGDEVNITTSEIISINFRSGRIETKHTIYVPLKRFR